MTVKELIEKLEKLPESLPIVIEDADTNWYLNIEKVETRGDNSNLVIVSGSYHNEYESS